MLTVTSRLLAEIRNVAPGVTEVRVGRRGDPASVRVFPADQQAQAQPTIDAFDWSDAAHASWEEDQQPQRKALRQQAAQAVSDNDAFLAIASPTNAQVLAQVKALTRQNTKIIQRLIKID